jgi:hypothetical protein
MSREEEIASKAAQAIANPVFTELIKWMKADSPENFVGKIKKVCESLKMENQLAASIRYAAILARDFPARFQKSIKERKVVYKLSFVEPTEEEKKDARDNNTSLIEYIEVEPLLTAELLITLELLEAKGSGCTESGADVRFVAPNTIRIGSTCPHCRTALIEKIIETLGKKITIFVE